MARARRTRFAASFVAVVATAGSAGCSHDRASGTGPGTAIASGTDAPAPKTRWSVSRGSDGNCWAEAEIHCPPPEVATCNPPAPMYVACKPDLADGARYDIVSFDGTHCVQADDNTAVPCPGYYVQLPPDAAPPPPQAYEARSWHIAKAGKACTAALVDPPCPPDVPCNPPAPLVVTCPPYADGMRVLQVAADTCYVAPPPMDCPRTHTCNPPPMRSIACPK
jgi:hypothetical protein